MSTRTIVKTFPTRLCFKMLIRRATTLVHQITNSQRKRVDFSLNTKWSTQIQVTRTTETIEGKSSRAP
jgi:hypothetical protein